MKTTSASRRWDLIGAIFDEALEKPPAERPAWLRDLCVEDSDLLREVERMLAAHERTAGILEQSFDGLESTFGGEERPTVLKGRIQDRQVGPYRILREAGHGGMGVVYQALDPRLDRYVALKFLPSPLRDGGRKEDGGVRGRGPGLRGSRFGIESPPRRTECSRSSFRNRP